jgi:hypothetical protein
MGRGLLDCDECLIDQPVHEKNFIQGAIAGCGGRQGPVATIARRTAMAVTHTDLHES